MNTPKKFRVWLPSLNKFGDDDSVLMDCYGKLYGVTRPSLLDGSRSIVNIGQFKELDGYTIQWYTELKDKNGVEIYEGDILQSTITNTFYQVKHGWYRQYEELELENGKIHTFNYSHIGFFVEYNENGEDCEGTLAIRNSNSVVVGNIFEHKHLLEK